MGGAHIGTSWVNVLCYTQDITIIICQVKARIAEQSAPVTHELSNQIQNILENEELEPLQRDAEGVGPN